MGSWKKVGKENTGLLGCLVCFHFNLPLLFIFLMIGFDSLMVLYEYLRILTINVVLGYLNLLFLTMRALSFCKIFCGFSLLKTH